LATPAGCRPGTGGEVFTGVATDSVVTGTEGEGGGSGIVGMLGEIFSKLGPLFRVTRGSIAIRGSVGAKSGARDDTTVGPTGEGDGTFTSTSGTMEPGRKLKPH